MSMEVAIIVVAMINGLFGVLILVQGKRTHDTFNSRMDQFIELIKETSYAEGKKAGKDGK